MAGFLTTGLSALIGARSALDVVGHNIANVNTPGYSRQRVNFVPQTPQSTPIGFIGSGVRASGVERFYDQFIFENITDGTSLQGNLATQSGYSDRINNILADPSIGLAPSLQGFFNALQDAVNDPASSELRQVVLGQADNLANRFNLVSREIENINSEINQSISSTVDEVNSLTSEIAELNAQIVVARNGSQTPPNDLLDQRDLRITELSELVGIELVEDSDGAINILAQPGNSLVTGPSSNKLSLGTDPLNPDRFVVRIQALSSGTPVDVPINGGRLGGLLEARSTIVDGVLSDLGRTALAVSESLNQQSAQGIDLNGNFGGDIFQIGTSRDISATDNLGSASLQSDIADLGALTGDEYRVDFDGTNYSFRRLGDNSAVTTTGTGAPGDPFVFDGLSVVVSGTAQAGDRFEIRPTRGAAGSIESVLTDPSLLALASPVTTSGSLSNLGDAVIGQERVVDITDPALLNGATIQFLTANTYSIDGSGSFAYTSGSPITVNGTEFEISGAPIAGDTFSLSANTDGRGDNRNGLLLVGLQSLGTLDNGNTGILESYSGLVTDVGASTRNLQAGLSAQTYLLDTAIAEQQEVSGVDLDEEAANLIRFQQSYQAAAQLVAVANTLFNELIGAVRR